MACRKGALRRSMPVTRRAAFCPIMRRLDADDAALRCFHAPYDSRFDQQMTLCCYARMSTAPATARKLRASTRVCEMFVCLQHVTPRIIGCLMREALFFCMPCHAMRRQHVCLRVMLPRSRHAAVVCLLLLMSCLCCHFAASRRRRQRHYCHA